MPLSDRENYLRTASMTNPARIPCRVHISDASWDQHREAMEQVAARHPTIFPEFRPGRRSYDLWEFAPEARAGERFTDSWGCVWTSRINGIVGQVVEHPLADWAALEAYCPPDPMKWADREPVHWQSERRQNAVTRAEGRLTSGYIAHGFLLMRLWYLRGFENLMLDIAEGEPRLGPLIGLVNAYNRAFVEQWLKMGVDVMSFGEDLGSQTASIISPTAFGRWIAPAYKDLMQPCRRAGCHVYLHSDGYIMELMDILLDCGVTIINPQDLCNGIDDLGRHVKGRICIDLDIDRQKIVPFGTQREIHDLIEEEVRKLGSPHGGLMLKAGIYPPTPPENVDALCQAMEEFSTYWWDGRG